MGGKVKKTVYLTKWLTEQRFAKFLVNFNKSERSKFSGIHIRKRTRTDGIKELCILVDEYEW